MNQQHMIEGCEEFLCFFFLSEGTKGHQSMR